MKNMTVNFNNLRRQAIHAYQSLAEKLNYAIIKDDDQYAKPNDVYHGGEVKIKGYVLIDADSIQRQMDDLRMLIGAIAMTYEEGNEDFKDMYQEYFPTEGKSMMCFNEEVESNN